MNCFLDVILAGIVGAVVFMGAMYLLGRAVAWFSDHWEEW